jgi:hypothetical protein
MNSSARKNVKLVAGPDSSSDRSFQPHVMTALTKGDSPVPDWSRRVPALGGLRGIAILLVLMGHSVFQMQTSSQFLSHVLAIGKLSWSGVDLFLCFRVS